MFTRDANKSLFTEKQQEPVALKFGDEIIIKVPQGNDGKTTTTITNDFLKKEGLRPIIDVFIHPKSGGVIIIKSNRQKGDLRINLGELIKEISEEKGIQPFNILTKTNQK